MKEKKQTSSTSIFNKWLSIRSSRIILVAVLAMTVIFGCLLPQLKFDYNFRKFFPSESSETRFFKTYQKDFKTDNDFILVSLVAKNTVFDSHFLKSAKSVALDFEKNPLVLRTQSLFNEFHLAKLGGSILKTPCLSMDPRKRERDSLAIFQRPELVKTIIDAKAKSICLIIFHQPGLSPETGKSLIAQVEKTKKDQRFEQVVVASRLTGENFYINRMSAELILFISLSGMLVIVFLIITFRSFWGVVLPMILLMLVVIWVVGLMVTQGIAMNILLTMLPSILFVVTMSDVIHLVAKYQENIRKGFAKVDSMKKAIKEVGLATFFTCFNTAIGFITLAFVGIEPIKIFGVVTGVGVIIAFVLTMIVLPALLIIFPTPRLLERREAPFWKAWLRKVFIGLLRQRKWVLIGSALFIGLGIFSLFRIETNAFLMDNVKADEPIKQDFDFFDQHYAGVRPFEMGIQLKGDESPLSYQTMVQIAEVEDYLQTHFGVKVVQGIGTYAKFANRVKHGGNPTYYRIPESNEWSTIKRFIVGAEDGKLRQSIINKKETILRIGGLIPDWGSKVNSGKMKKFKHWFKTQKKEATIVPTFTGSAYLYDKNAESLSDNILQGLSFSIGIVGIIMAFIFRSWVMGFISVIPNLIPLVALTSMMGLLDIELKISTALVFTISFGIAVDDTIHFLSKFRHEIASGKSVIYALKTSYMTTGKAMILTAFLLCLGFLTMVFSSFLGTFYMGVMVSFSLVFALIADLLLLPVLLLLFFPRKNIKRA